MTATFTQIPPELVSLLPRHMHEICATVAHDKGDLLFMANEIPAYMFFVVRGEVILERVGLNGLPVVLQRTRHGFLGEASLQSLRYHCDGKVLAASEITRIPIQDVRAGLERDPVFASRWIGMLNSEVKRLRLQCERLSLNKVHERLLHLVETEGHDGKYPLGTGIKSLAGELGVTHEALYRCVADLEKKKMLFRDAGYLQLSM